MKRRNLFVFLFLVILGQFVNYAASAQLDPAAESLLKSGATSPNLDSSRYTIKKSAATAPTPIPTATPSPTPSPEPTRRLYRQIYVTPTPSPSPTPVSNKSSNEIDEYAELHPDDPRQNLLGLTVAPAYFYIDSHSEYWFRKYHSGSPALSLGAEVWATPQFALHSYYVASLGADITASPSSTEKLSVDHRYFGLGMKWRSFLGVSRKSPAMIFGLGYDEYQMTLPMSADERIRLKSSGAIVEMGVRLPLTVGSAWVAGTQLIPKLRTTEEKTSSANATSGSRDGAYAWSVYFGKEFVLSRNQQFFWKLWHRVDKHNYLGAASTADPISGATPEGVSVRSSATLFSIGFTWGD